MDKRTAFNYSKLRGKIVEVFGTEKVFAEKLGISSVALSYKLNNKREFTTNEIYLSAELLGIQDDIKSYFFVPFVNK